MNILITGGSRGIGKAIAEKFAGSGANIAVCGRDKKELDTFKKTFSEKYDSIDIMAHTCDVSDKKQVADFAGQVRRKWLHLDVLINNAGVFMPGQVHKEEDGVMEKQMAINVYGAYYITRAFVDMMIKKKAGHIINICSVASITAYLNGGSYCMSKFAMLGFSKVLREEMKAYNIKVTSVLPGATLTSSWEGEDIPAEKLMRPEDVADMIFQVYNISDRTNVEEILMRPIQGDV